jgi:integrase
MQPLSRTSKGSEGVALLKSAVDAERSMRNVPGSNPAPGVWSGNRGAIAEALLVMRPYARWTVETDEVLADYARWALRRYRPSTVERDLRVLRRLKKDGVLDREEVAFMRWLEGYQATYQTRFVFATTYLRWLRFRGIRPSPELIGFYRDLDRMREKKLARIPSYETAKAVIASIRPSQSRNFFALILETGLRFGEAYALRWDQIDWEGKRLIMEKSEKRSEGSYLPLSDAALAILRDQQRYTANQPFVFTVSRRNLVRALGRAKARCNLPGAELVNAKNLRHLFATRWYAMTRDLVLVQRLLRHRTITTTQRYVHMVTATREFDVRVVDDREVEAIKVLLSQGYDVALQAKGKVYLRRAKI